MADLLTVKQVAHYLNVSRSHVYDLMHEAKLPYVKIGGAYRISRETLEAWIIKNTINRNVELLDEASLDQIYSHKHA